MRPWGKWSSGLPGRSIEVSVVEPAVQSPPVASPPAGPYEFSLVERAALDRLLRRGPAYVPPPRQWRRRTALIVALAWVPLFALSIWEGHAWSGAGVAFLFDVGSQVRFLVVLPLLIAAQRILHARTREVFPRLIELGMIHETQRPKFAGILASAQRALDSVPVAILTLVLVYSMGLGGLLPKEASIAGDTWYRSGAREGGLHITAAGWWLALVSLPMMQFLLLRWYFRLLVWWRLLWQVSRLELRLEPLHPDRMCGFGTLSRLSYAFVPLVFAQAALTAGLIADQILYSGAALRDFRFAILAAAIVMVVLVVGPLLAFVPALWRAKLRGLDQLELLAMRYSEGFTAKWLRPGVPTSDALLGSPDPSTLADLGATYSSVESIRPVPISMPALLALFAAAIVPMLPLLLTTFSLEQLVSKLVTILF